MLIHREALELARNAAANEEGTPFSITCVYVSEDGAATVTDGHLWLRMKAAVDEPSLFDELAQPGAGADSDGPVLVPADVMAAFNAAMKKRKKTKDGPVPHVVVSKVNSHITLSSSDGKTRRTFLIDDVGDVKFPDVDKTVKRQPTRHVVLGVDLLISMLRTLKACGAPAVKLGLPDEENSPITLSATCESGPIDGAVMPMRE